MNRIFFALLFLAFAAYGQQKQIAIINTEDDGEPPIGHSELNHLTSRLRDIAVKMLPQKNYGVMTQQSIVAYLGSQDEMVKKCKESKGCLAQLGREINADYICQGRLGRFGEDFTINAELYDVKSGILIGSLNGSSKDIYGLLSVLDNEAPNMFKQMPGVSDSRIAPSPSVAGGISGLQSSADYVLDDEKRQRHLVNLSTEPEGATLSFNGEPIAGCAKTPCRVEVTEGGIRIIAVLEQYERADTTILIKRNNQINIKLKPNFGVFEVKPAYSEGIGKNENWNLAINGKAASSWENRLSPGKYSVKLSHRCYEDISFDVGINKGSREVFDMASYAKPKKGGLDLSAEKEDGPVSEPVFVNGIRAGETPFNGSVAVCSEIEIGLGKEKVNVKLEHKQIVRYVHKILSTPILAEKKSNAGYSAPAAFLLQKSFVIEDISFVSGKADITDDSYANLMMVVETMQTYPEVKFKVVGHTDDQGKREANQKLSETRAKAVVDFLISRGISSSRLDYEGKGQDQPIASKKTAAGRAKNCRIEFLRTDKSGKTLSVNDIGSSGDCRMETDKAKAIYDKCIKMGKAASGYAKCAEEYNTQRGKAQQTCHVGTVSSEQAEFEKLVQWCAERDNNVKKYPQCGKLKHQEVKMEGTALIDKRDGKTYKTVKIGSQTWMAENLNYDAKGSKCYNNDPASCEKYGRLYAWATSACPSGWHLPGKDEWQELVDFVGGNEVAGTYLKAKSGWNDNEGVSGNGTDNYGFSALPGGYFDRFGYSDRFFGVGHSGGWWSASKSNSYGAHYRFMLSSNDLATLGDNSNTSIRCLHD